MEAECKCHACGKKIMVDFVIEPTEAEKLGFYCKPCAKEHKDVIDK